MKTKLKIFCATLLLMSATVVYGQEVSKGMNGGKLVADVKYTYAEVISLFGEPDRYYSWGTEGDLGQEFAYGTNFFRIDSQFGFNSFGLTSGDFILKEINNLKVGDNISKLQTFPGSRLISKGSNEYWFYHGEADDHYTIIHNNGIITEIRFSASV